MSNVPPPPEHEPVKTKEPIPWYGYPPTTEWPIADEWDDTVALISGVPDGAYLYSVRVSAYGLASACVRYPQGYVEHILFYHNGAWSIQGDKIISAEWSWAYTATEHATLMKPEER